MNNLVDVKCKEEDNHLVLFGCIKLQDIDADTIIIRINIDTLKLLSKENGIIDLTIETEKI